MRARIIRVDKGKEVCYKVQVKWLFVWHDVCWPNSDYGYWEFSTEEAAANYIKRNFHVNDRVVREYEF